VTTPNKETPVKPKRGRPATGRAKTNARRQQEYRTRSVDTEDKPNEALTFNQLLLRLADMNKQTPERRNYFGIKMLIAELSKRNELTKPD
jgi:hypothetical protein